MSKVPVRSATDARRLGRYEVLLVLGSDGFVTTFVARIRGPHVGARTVEISRVAGSLSREAEIRAAFLAEARASGRVHHVNYVQPVDTLLYEGNLYLATELVHGIRLDGLVAAVAAARARVPVGVAVRIALDVLAGLSAVHTTTLSGAAARPLVHGDVVPCNIVVSYRGISRLVHSGLSLAASRIGAVGGHNERLAYKAPEQLRTGLRAVPIGPGADLFAVGVILWELLSGERLFEAGSDLGTVERVLSGEIPKLGSRARAPVNDALATILSVALVRDADRPTTSAADLGDALEHAIGPDLASEDDVAHFIDRLVGPMLERRREELEKHLQEAESTSDRDPSEHDLVSKLPSSSPTVPPASSGRIRGASGTFSTSAPPPSRRRGERSHRRALYVALYVALGALLGIGVALLSLHAAHPAGSPSPATAPAAP